MKYSKHTTATSTQAMQSHLKVLNSPCHWLLMKVPDITPSLQWSSDHQLAPRQLFNFWSPLKSFLAGFQRCVCDKISPVKLAARTMKSENGTKSANSKVHERTLHSRAYNITYGIGVDGTAVKLASKFPVVVEIIFGTPCVELARESGASDKRVLHVV